MTKTILIVERNELHLKLFNDILQANSYKTVLTKDKRKTFNLAKTHQPDLIIIGIQMPSMSDLANVKLIKADVDLGKKPILAVTALTMRDDEENIRSCGCDGYITKPISIPKFLETIDIILSQFPQD